MTSLRMLAICVSTSALCPRRTRDGSRYLTCSTRTFVYIRSSVTNNPKADCAVSSSPSLSVLRFQLRARIHRSLCPPTTATTEHDYEYDYTYVVIRVSARLKLPYSYSLADFSETETKASGSFHADSDDYWPNRAGQSWCSHQGTRQSLSPRMRVVVEVGVCTETVPITDSWRRTS
eukprot:scaffold74978_cov44-Prasinocladus_malaysianus.AAC.2